MFPNQTIREANLSDYVSSQNSSIGSSYYWL